LTLKRLLYPLLAHPHFTQVAKYIVYTGLVINGVLYMRDDYVAMISALPDNATLLDYFTQIATSIDTLGWLGLVFLFELETYALPEEKWTTWLGRLIHSLRIACYLAIAGATYGYTIEGLEYYDYSELPAITDACELADQGIVMQLDQITYVDITTANCSNLSDGDRFVHIANEVSVVDEATLHHLQFQGWVDILNAYFWLVVVFLIEVELWFQNRDRFSGPLLNGVRATKSFSYLLLILNMFIWWYQGYYRYAWDAFLWIFGFWAIELNLAEWEVERLEELRTR
jgi:hypothetical protein